MPHPCQHLLMFLFLTIVILGGVRRYLVVVVICVSLMANDAENLCACFLALYSFSEEMSIKVHWQSEEKFESLGEYIQMCFFLSLKCLRFFHMGNIERAEPGEIKGCPHLLPFATMY